MQEAMYRLMHYLTHDASFNLYSFCWVSFYIRSHPASYFYIRYKQSRGI